MRPDHAANLQPPASDIKKTIPDASRLAVNLVPKLPQKTHSQLATTSAKMPRQESLESSVQSLEPDGLRNAGPG
jgi:hypothetical protein